MDDTRFNFYNGSKDVLKGSIRVVTKDADERVDPAVVPLLHVLLLLEMLSHQSFIRANCLEKEDDYENIYAVKVVNLCKGRMIHFMLYEKATYMIPGRTDNRRIQQGIHETR